MTGLDLGKHPHIRMSPYRRQMAEAMGREEKWGRERVIVEVEHMALVAKQ